MELFIYLLKVTGCTAAFYIVYYTLFRKLTFFTLNRWYLVASLLISLLIPLIHISVQTMIAAPDVKPAIINTSTQTIDSVADPVILQQPVQHINWESIAVYAYWVIAALLLVKLIITLVGIVYKGRKYGKRQNGYRLANNISTNNSSFFNYLFLNTNQLDIIEQEQVITHELVHAKLLHSADNLFTEVLKAFLWLNPFVYLYSKALHQVHEFEVDSHLANQYNSKSYASLLLKLSMPASTGISNQFSAYGLKSRVQMLFKSKSATAKKLGYILMLPVVMALVYFLAVDKVYAYSEDTGLNKNFVLVLDAGHGGKQTGSVSENGISEKDLNLAIVKQIKAIADQHGIKTILTRDADKDVSLNDRLSSAGNVFVSVHINNAPAKGQNNYNGITLLINKNKNYDSSKQLANVFKDKMKQLQGISTADTIADNQHIKVLRDNNAPALLLELGYLSNPSDLKYITNKQNQQAIAQKFIDAILAYKKTSQPKISGAIIKPDTGLKVSVNIAIVPHAKAQTDTAKKIASAINGPLTFKNVQSMTISDSDDGSTLPADRLSEDFKNIRYTAKDSTRADHKNKAIYLYGDVTVTTPKLHITAKSISYSMRDSVLIANGNVHLQMRGNKKESYSTAIEIDSLRVDLRNHLKAKKN